jgi:hypothetical protein
MTSLGVNRLTRAILRIILAPTPKTNRFSHLWNAPISYMDSSPLEIDDDGPDAESIAPVRRPLEQLVVIVRAYSAGPAFEHVGALPNDVPKSTLHVPTRRCQARETSIEV